MAYAYFAEAVRLRRSGSRGILRSRVTYVLLLRNEIGVRI